MPTLNVQRLPQVHKALCAHTPGLAPACEASVKAHITLLVMHLADQAQLDGEWA